MPEVGPEILAGRGILLVDVEGEGEAQDELYVRIGRIPVKVISSNYTLDLDEDEHAYIVVTDAAAITFPPGAPSGWGCAIRHGGGAFACSITHGVGVTINAVDNLHTITPGKAISVVSNGSNTYYVDGALE